MRHATWARPLGALLALTLLLASPAPPASAAPDGQMSWAVHVSIAPTWFDPAEHPGIVTTMMIFYALHDALVKPMPGKPAAPSLAESWTVSPDGLVHEFVLRRGVVFGARTSTGPTRRSTTSSPSRRGSSTARSARSCSTRSSASRTSG